MNDNNCFDFLLIGTGYTQALLSSALASSGYKCLHVDHNDYYGGDWATIPLSQFPHSSTINTLTNAHKFLGSLSPSVLITQRSAQTQLEYIIRSTIFHYLEFRLVDAVIHRDADGAFTQIPKSKQEVFRSGVGVKEKRMLMKFLQSVANGDYKSQPSVAIKDLDVGLPEHILHSLLLSFGMACTLDEDAHATLDRISTFLHSHGAYGASSFLYAQYGGVGDIIQGYCRSSAVHGSTFILNRGVESASRRQAPDGGFEVRVSGIDEVFSVGAVIGEAEELAALGVAKKASQGSTQSTLGRAVLVLSKAPLLDPFPDSPIIVYAPGLAFRHAVHAHYEDAAAGVCPAGYYVAHFAVPLDTDAGEHNNLDTLFQPYVDSLAERAEDIAYLCVYADVQEDCSGESAGDTNVHVVSSKRTTTAPFVQPAEDAVKDAVRIFEAATGKSETEMFSGVKRGGDEENEEEEKEQGENI